MTVTASCVVTGNHRPPYDYEGAHWTQAEIRSTVRYPARGNAGQQVIGKVIGHAEGIVVQRDGKRLRCQVWADHPWQGCVWVKVYEGDADFAGEMLIAKVDRGGKVTGWADSFHSYHADGSKCTSWCRSQHAAQPAAA